VIKFGRFGKRVAGACLGWALEPFKTGFLDKDTSLGYEFRASFMGVITFPSGPQKPGLFEIGMFLSPLASGRR
jgi:hypothetical protein